MEFNEADPDFNVEDVSYIIKQAIMSTLQQSTLFDSGKVDGWCHNITENCIHELKNLNKPFKYMVTVLLAENNGAGLHTATGAFWDTKRDDIVLEKLERGSILCVVSILGVSLSPSPQEGF